MYLAFICSLLRNIQILVGNKLATAVICSGFVAEGHHANFKYVYFLELCVHLTILFYIGMYMYFQNLPLPSLLGTSVYYRSVRSWSLSIILLNALCVPELWSSLYQIVHASNCIYQKGFF